MNFILYMSINQRTYKIFSRLSNQQVSLSLPMSTIEQVQNTM